MLLTRKDVCLDISDSKGDSPLHWACRMGQIDTVLLLLNKGVIQHPNNMNATPLFEACRKGYSELVYLLLVNDAEASTAQDEEGNTPLLIAAREGHCLCVELLVRYGAADVYTDWV